MSLGKAILDAAITGNEHAVAAWLDEGGSVDAGCADHGGTTVLIAAANEGNEAMVRMLLQRGASVNLQTSIGVTALMGAAFNGHTTIAQVLLDAKADASLQTKRGSTALMAAEQQKQTAAAQLLRQHAERRDAAEKTGNGKKKKAKAAPTSTGAAGSSAAAPLASTTRPSAAEEGLPDGVGLAVVQGNERAVAAWLDKGGSVDAKCAERIGTTLLMEVAAGGQEAMVRMLLQRGASVNLQSSDGFTALMLAAANGHTTIAQALLDSKADASLQAINGSTALMWAEDQKHTATAQLLRQHAKRQAAEAEAKTMHAATAAPTPDLSGGRVRIFGLKGRPELNGRCGVAGRFYAATGRCEVAVEGEAEAVLLKPANLQETTSDLPNLTLPLR